MRLLSFSHHGRRSVGAELNAEHVLDFHIANHSLPPRMREFLELGEDAMDLGRRLMKAPPRGAIVHRREIHVLSPLCPEERPKIFCIGLNYADHAAESGSKVPEDPLVFSKFFTALISPGDPIPYPPDSSALDYETELVIVIGKPAKRVPQEEAQLYVAGYTCGNDVTARDLQRRHVQWYKGKGLDGFCPMGPVVVTADEIGDPHQLDISLRVNGVEKQRSNTRHLIFRIPRLIAEWSAGMTLYPGDVLLTGTPSGVGVGRTPPEFLRPGDVVEAVVGGIGVLRNVVSSGD